MNTLYHPQYRIMIERLVQARKEAGLTQIEVAEKMGKTQGSVSKIEHCQKRVDILELMRFSELYRIDPLEILQAKRD